MNETTFILYGATGDLAKRKIFPALYNLFLDGFVKDSFAVVNLGRKDYNHETFRDYIVESIEKFSRRPLERNKSFNDFLSRFYYQKLNIDKLEDYQNLHHFVKETEQKHQTRNRLFYFSISPEFFTTASEMIKKSGLSNTGGWKRLMIEKPFGTDLSSAHELNEKLSKSFSEEEIYRIDHYLGKAMVQNLNSLIYDNPVLANVWNKDSVSNIQISAIETVGVETRASYYDHAGAIRDMFQNHMLQMLSLIASDDYHLSSISSEKKKVLESLRHFSKEALHNHIIRGQYESYLNESGVDPESKTETFIAARIYIDNEKWKGVPFYIRSGKKASEKMTKIVVNFHNPANKLLIEINPEEKITLTVQSNLSGIPLSFTNHGDSQEAYEILIHDGVFGDSTFFAHWDEVRTSWEFVQPILEASKENLLPIYKYPIGTDGPKASDELLNKDGFKWN